LAETLVTIVLERILPKVEQVVISSMYNGDKKNDESYSFAECAHGLEWQRLADNERKGQPIHQENYRYFGGRFKCEYARLTRRARGSHSWMRCTHTNARSNAEQASFVASPASSKYRTVVQALGDNRRPM
jgi:hypothetical protein